MELHDSNLTVGPFSSRACLKWIPSTKMSPQEDQVNHQLTFDNCWELFKLFKFSLNTFSTVEIPQSLSDIKPEPDLSLEALVLVSPTAQIHPTRYKPKLLRTESKASECSNWPKIWLFETHKVLAHCWSPLPKSLSFQRLSLPGCFKSCGSKRKHWLHWSFSSLHTFLAATQKDWPYPKLCNSFSSTPSCAGCAWTISRMQHLLQSPREDSPESLADAIINGKWKSKRRSLAPDSGISSLLITKAWVK